MQEINNDKHLNDYDDGIDLQELFYVLLQGKWIIVSMTAFISIIGVIYSLLLPNIYESKALLVPVSASSTVAGSLGSYGYGSLLGLAGLGLNPVSDRSNSAKAIKKINSLSFFEDNIMPNIYLSDLMAVESWDSQTNTLTFDDTIYDKNSNTWIREVSYPRKKIPSAQESFKVFSTGHLRIGQDKKSGFVTLSIKHKSPFVAKEWNDLIVNEINSFYRQKDKSESERAAKYLNQQISMTSFSEIKQVLAELLQEETKKLTLIEANKSYVFDYIDPPAVMERKSEPNRAKICILIAIFGGMLSILYVLIRHYVFSKKTY